MKIYQVYSGDTDKHGRQTKDYLATYLDRDMALAHCYEIVNKLKFEGEDIEVDNGAGHSRVYSLTHKGDCDNLHSK